MTVFEQNEYESLVQGLMTKNDGILDNYYRCTFFFDGTIREILPQKSNGIHR